MVNKIAEEMDITQISSKELFDSFFAVLQEILSEGGSFTEYGFGTFYVEDQDQRQGFNPHTRKKMILPRRVKMHFSPSDVLRDAVNEE